MSAQDSIKEFEAISFKIDKVRKEIQSVVFGQDRAVNLTLAGLLAGGHIMLMGVPGLAKTLLVDTISTVVGLGHKRIQCTPDLMPSDVIGVEILQSDGKTGNHFHFEEGPVFTHILMADEINRASPRTQSALLQAMQEKKVTVAGEDRNLPDPFHVLATRNPLEQEGTYALPEAQLDRFLMQVHIEYPDAATEKEILIKTTGEQTQPAQEILYRDDLKKIQNFVKAMPVGEGFFDRVVRIVQSARPETSALENVQSHVDWPPGPRAGQALVQAAKANALLNGRMTPDSSDLDAVAYAVLNHRMTLQYAAYADSVTLLDVIEELLEAAG